MPPKASLPIKGYGKLEGKTISTTSTPLRPTPESTETKSKGKRPASASSSTSIAKRTITAPPTKITASFRNASAPHLSYLSLSPSWTAPSPPTAPSSKPRTITLTYHVGSIFACPPSTLLIHACNTLGHWGAGIALAFKQRYPRAYAAHNKFCAKEHNPKGEGAVPRGSAQVMMPLDRSDGEREGEVGEEVFVGCVFTSARYGRAKDKPDEILRNTTSAMEMLLELVRVHNERVDAALAEKGKGEGEAKAGDGVATIGKIGEIRMCKINSGKFGVPWERTAKALESIVVREGWRGSVQVWDLEAS